MFALKELKLQANFVDCSAKLNSSGENEEGMEEGREEKNNGRRKNWRKLKTKACLYKRSVVSSLKSVDVSSEIGRKIIKDNQKIISLTEITKMDLVHDYELFCKENRAIN